MTKHVHPRRPESLDQIPGVLLAYDTGDFAVQRMRELTDALHTASRRILDIERDAFGGNATGNVLLLFSDCGTGCMGCPHPTWRQVKVRYCSKIGSENYGERFLAHHRITRPSRVSRVQHHPVLHAAVLHALDVIEARTRLIDLISRLRRHLKSKEVPRYLAPAEPTAEDPDDATA